MILSAFTFANGIFVGLFEVTLVANLLRKSCSSGSPNVVFVVSWFFCLSPFEPCHEIMALFVLRKLNLQTRMHSHLLALDVRILVGFFVYFHTFMYANREGSGETARMRMLAWAFAGRLCDKCHNLMSWRVRCCIWDHYHTEFGWNNSWQSPSHVHLISTRGVQLITEHFRFYVIWCVTVRISSDLSSYMRNRCFFRYMAK